MPDHHPWLIYRLRKSVFFKLDSPNACSKSFSAIGLRHTFAVQIKTTRLSLVLSFFSLLFRPRPYSFLLFRERQGRMQSASGKFAISDIRSIIFAFKFDLLGQFVPCPWLVLESILSQRLPIPQPTCGNDFLILLLCSSMDKDTTFRRSLGSVMVSPFGLGPLACGHHS